MFYEYIENLKARLYFLRHKDDEFVPAGSEPIQEAKTTSSGFSFDSIKNFNLKEMSFETKRLLVLAAVFLVAIIGVGKLSANLNSFRAERDAYRKAHAVEKTEDAWDKYKKEKSKLMAEPAAASSTPSTIEPVIDDNGEGTSSSGKSS